VRFLPNPYFVPSLQRRVGTEEPVQDYVLAAPEAQEFLRRFQDLLVFLLPLYEKEGKTSVTVAIGCTGGKHRSVSLIEELGRRLETEGREIRILHRDVER